MSKKVLILGHIDHGRTEISQRVIEALTATGKEPIVVNAEELPEEEFQIPKLIQQKEIKDGKTNRRERRKQKRLK